MPRPGRARRISHRRTTPFSKQPKSCCATAPYSPWRSLAMRPSSSHPRARCAPSSLPVRAGRGWASGSQSWKRSPGEAPQSEPGPSLRELGGLLGAGAARDARLRIADRRNAEAHLRPVDRVDLPTALRETFADLELLAKHPLFLADWPLVHVTSVEWDAYRRKATLNIRRLMGDHPVVPTTTMTYGSSEVENRSLYVADRDHRLYLLRPFLIGQICPMCRTRSTFHIDKVHGKFVHKSGSKVKCGVSQPSY